MQETPCFITLPFEEIIALRGLLQDYTKDKQLIAQMKAEINGLRSVQSEMLLKLSVLSRRIPSDL